VCPTPKTFETTIIILLVSLADPRIYLGKTKIPKRKLMAKPESKVLNARESRPKSESRVRRNRELKGKHEPRAKPEKKHWSMGGGQGMGLCEPSTEQFWKIKLDTIHFDSIFEAFIWNNQQNGSYAHNHENSNTYFDVMELLNFGGL